jgi:hypothetical protein
MHGCSHLCCACVFARTCASTQTLAPTCCVAAVCAGAVRDIHSQDSIHNGKKLINPLDSSCRVLALGNYTATINHIHIIYDKYDVTQHGLRANDVRRSDRQNWAACERLAMRRVRATLRLLIDAENVPAQGTIAYLEVSTSHICRHSCTCTHMYTRTHSRKPRTRAQKQTYAHAHTCTQRVGHRAGYLELHL